MSTSYLIGVFVLTFGLAMVLTWLVSKLAKALKIMDYPDNDRKLHQLPVPLLGGIGIFLAFFTVLFLVHDKIGAILAASPHPYSWLGVFLGAVLLMVGGFLDDKYNLKPKWQIIWPLLAAGCVVAGGIGIDKITGTGGDFVYLNSWQIPLFYWHGYWRHFVVLTDSFTILWLLGMMYTTKLLDGLDGLVSGLSAIASLVVFLFTMTTRYYQPDIGLAALILAAACLGFLVFNWHPAKIFLGEGGSLFLGFILGVLSIISGGKIAIALLIMGIPILDAFWTIIRRILAGVNPFKTSDRRHLHHRLLDFGLSMPQVALIFYILAALFGLTALFLQSSGKILILVCLAILTMVGLIILAKLDKKSKIS